MANDILQKYGTTLPLTITLSALPTSTTGYKGRKSVFVTNATRGYEQIMLFVSIREGTNAVSNKSVRVKLLRSDLYGSIAHAGTFRTDNVAAGDVAATTLSAQMIGILGNIGTTGRILKKEFVFQNPGKAWSLFITHDMGVNLGNTVSANVTGNYVRWAGIKPQVQ